jgi:hypothetical protein
LASNRSWRKALSDNPQIEQLRKQLHTVTVGSRKCYIAEGDLRLEDDAFLIYARDRLGITNGVLGTMPASHPIRKIGRVEAFITGFKIDGKVVRWENPHLSYCVRRSTFADANQYDTVVRNMRAASQAWSSVCNVSFTHNTHFDNGNYPIDADDATPTPVTFIVEGFSSGGAFIASAFFPSDPGWLRRLYVDPSYFAAGMEYDPVGVFRHELGHVLGFVHEQINSGAPPVCPQDAPAGQPFQFTEYDPHSVMHYFCGGVGTHGMELDQKDVIGAQILYGVPTTGVILRR